MRQFYGKIENKKLILRHPELLKDYIAKINGDVVLKIQRKYKQRTLLENDYFHGVLLRILMTWTGYSKEEMKGVIKWMFKIESTANLSTKTFEEKMEEIRMMPDLEFDVALEKAERKNNCYIFKISPDSIEELNKHRLDEEYYKVCFIRK